MDLELIADEFREIGARLVVERIADTRPSRRHLARMRALGQKPVQGRDPAATLDVRSDRGREHFLLEVRLSRITDLRVIDRAPGRQHLLLQLIEEGGRMKHKFLCGHDERHWFVAAIPPVGGVTSVETAMEALKPPEVVAAQVRQLRHQGDRLRRRNAAFTRQGEWFFVPAQDLEFDPVHILRNEPLQRSRGSKPHMAEECLRQGGETVYVHRRFPAGLTQRQFEEIVRDNPGARKWGWRIMQRGARVYVRGRIRHVDHRTVHLTGWHRVLMNTVNGAPGMSHVSFLD